MESESQDDENTYSLSVELPSLKSLFIEMFFGEQLLSTGTVIFVSNDQNSHCTLVTNRHNVIGRDQETGRCLKTVTISALLGFS